jgi:hypothetical protein
MEDETFEVAHEGDSAFFTRIMMMVHETRKAYTGVEYAGKVGLLIDKIDTAYTRYAITAQQWSMLYDTLLAPAEATAENDEPVYRFEQSKTQPARTPPSRNGRRST